MIGRPLPLIIRLVAALATAAALLVPADARACAACGNPSLPQLPTGTGSRTAGLWSLNASLQTAPLSVSHPAGCADPLDCNEIVVQPEHTHELTSVPIELRISTQWSVTRKFGLEAELPFRAVVQRADYQTADGDPYTPVDAGVHHRDEVVLGLADAQLRARALVVLDRWWLTLRAGTSLPIGSTVEDPFELGDRGETHQHVQLGTGTFDPSIGGDLTRGWTGAQWSVYGSGQFSLYENRHGFRAGPRGQLGTMLGWKARPGLLPYATLEGAFQGAEKWNGEIRQDGLLGRRELRAGLGLRWLPGTTALDFAVRVPVYRQLVEGEEEPGELRAPVSVSLSAGWTFGG